jgi:hypothetical protein
VGDLACARRRAVGAARGDVLGQPHGPRRGVA